MMADRVRFAHIGVSFPHAIGYLESLLLMPEVEIVALHDPDPGAARGLLPAALQSHPMYDDVADLLAHAARGLKAVEQLGPDRLDAFDWSLTPRVRWVASERRRRSGS